MAGKIWQQHFGELKAFFEENHHLRIPEEVRCENGASLRRWAQEQRKHFQNGSMKPEQERAIRAAGMLELLESPEETALRHVRKFYQKYGNLDMPGNYVCEDGYRLGAWITMARVRSKKDEISAKLREELDAMGMIWDKYSYEWEQAFADCKAFYDAHGSLDFPEGYKGSHGTLLRKWVEYNRQCFRKSQLTEAQISKLKSIGALSNFHRRKWVHSYGAAPKKPRRELHIRISDRELRLLENRARSAGFPSVQAYVSDVIERAERA